MPAPCGTVVLPNIKLIILSSFRRGPAVSFWAAITNLMPRLWKCLSFAIWLKGGNNSSVVLVRNFWSLSVTPQCYLRQRRGMAETSEALINLIRLNAELLATGSLPFLLLLTVLIISFSSCKFCSFGHINAVGVFYICILLLTRYFSLLTAFLCFLYRNK